ncbi:MAG: MerR family transcriptional regulator [Bacteroidetes bacterium RIFCSPHIGHO2_02_FULL_44_7]|nr:MAG: MerR family transcriptional regulator [Bacteroidetes bacterium RIFCSPHIGHO2_02_FULL_44_7]
MNSEKFIPLQALCTHYEVETSFFTLLDEYGLIEIQTHGEALYIHQDRISDVEKMIRLHRELDLNFEGIDTVLHLLDKIAELQKELTATKNRLRLYED